MAFQMDFSIPAGMNIAAIAGGSDTQVLIKTEPYAVANGYLYIGDMQVDESNQAVFDLLYKKSKDDSLICLSKSFSFFVDVTDMAKNFKKQGYEYLKTLDEFKDAVDVLEEGQTV